MARCRQSAVALAPVLHGKLQSGRGPIALRAGGCRQALGFLQQDAPNAKSAEAIEVCVFARDGKEHILDAQIGKETFKRMSQALRGSKWDSRDRAASPGATTLQGQIADIMKRYTPISGDTLKMGSAVPELRMGQGPAYIRPHVCRKLFSH